MSSAPRGTVPIQADSHQADSHAGPDGPPDVDADMPAGRPAGCAPRHPGNPARPPNAITGQTAGEAGADDAGLRRLKQRRDFLRVAAKGRKAARDGLVLQGAPTPAAEAGSARIGFTTSRKVGNAVARNRAKRRLRAVADLVLRGQAQTGHDYVLIGRKATLERDFAALCSDCRQALRRLKLARDGGR